MIVFTSMIMFLFLTDLAIFCADMLERRLPIIHFAGCASCLLFAATSPSTSALLGLMFYQAVFFEMQGDQLVMQLFKTLGIYCLGYGLLVQTYLWVSLLFSCYKLVSQAEY